MLPKVRINWNPNLFVPYYFCRYSVSFCQPLESFTDFRLPACGGNELSYLCYVIIKIQEL